MHILQRSPERLVFRKYVTPLPTVTILLGSLMGIGLITMLWSSVSTFLNATDIENIGLSMFYLLCAYIFGLATWHSFNQEEIAYHIVDKKKNALFKCPYYVLPLPAKWEKRCDLDKIENVEILAEEDNLEEPQEFVLILYITDTENIELNSRFAASKKDLQKIQDGVCEVVTFLGFEMVIKRKNNNQS